MNSLDIHKKLFGNIDKNVAKLLNNIGNIVKDLDCD